VVSLSGAQVARSVIVGTDLVSVGEIESSIERFGERFLHRIYTRRELGYCMKNPHASSMRLAARFAAKEAVRKVLRIDDEAVSWRSIEVERRPAGWCELVLHQEARKLARRTGFVAFSVSMSHEASYASAVVVGELERGGTPK
jgi:holo-[acyl-carrier protein] synthase